MNRGLSRGCVLLCPNKNGFDLKTLGMKERQRSTDSAKRPLYERSVGPSFLTPAYMVERRLTPFPSVYFKFVRWT